MMTGERSPELRLLTIDQARVAMGGMARSTIFELLRDGQLVSLKIGRRRYIRPCDLDAYLARLISDGAS